MSYNYLKKAIQDLIEQRLKDHQEALDSMPKTDINSVAKRLEAMGRMMMVLEMEHKHQGAILELKELQKLIKEI